MIGSCNCPITANCLITLSDYNFADQLEQNTAVYSPITFEEIVIVMINLLKMHNAWQARELKTPRCRINSS